MADNERMRRRLIRLWLADRRCYFCRRPTVLVVSPGGRKPTNKKNLDHFPERASIDHLHSRFSENRKQLHGIETTVLACYECNQRRGREEQAAIPTEELNRRSGRVVTKQFAAQPAEEGE